MDCRQIREELSAYIDGVLNEPLLQKVEAHLKACPGCAAEAEELREVVGMVRALGDIAPPAEFRGQVMARLRDEGAGSPAGAGETARAGAGAGLMGFIRRGQFIAAAAVLVLGIGVSMLWAKGFISLNPYDRTVKTPEKTYSLAGAPKEKGAAGEVGEMKNEQKIAYLDEAVKREKALADNLQADSERRHALKQETVLPKYSIAANTDRASVASRSTGAKNKNDGIKIVSDGIVKINVSDLNAAELQVERVAAEMGGRVERDAPVVSITAADAASKSLRVVVPGGKFDQAVGSLGKVGKVVDKQVNTRDVTGEYSDMEARIDSLEMKEKQLAGLAENTVSPAEKAGVEEDLRRTQEELAFLREQLAGLDSAVNYAIITLELNEQG